MGIINVEDIGEVEIAGDAPTREEAQMILAAQAKLTQGESLSAGGAVETALQGLTFDFSDELQGFLAGAGNATLNLLQGLPQDTGTAFDEGFTEARNEALAKLGQARRAAPVAAFALQTAGTLLPTARVAQAVGIGARGLRSAIGRLAAIGGAEGALSGAGAGEGATDRLVGAGVGAGVGATLGVGVPGLAKLVGSTVSRGLQATGVSDPTKTAIRKIGRAFERDQIDAETALASLSDLRGVGFLADVGGGNLAGLLGSAARLPGRGREIVTNALESRNFSASERTRQNIRELLDDSPDFFQQQAEIIARRSQSARPLYDIANQTEISLTPALANILSKPQIKRFWDKARDIAAVDDIEIKPLFSVNEAGEKVLNEGVAPDIATLNAVKRSLDSVVEKSRNQLTGVLNQADPEIRAFDTLRKRLISATEDAERKALGLGDGMITPYGAARAAFSDEARIIDALNTGKKMAKGNKDPREIAKSMERFPNSEREFFQAGFADEMLSKTEETVKGGVTRLARTEGDDKRLLAVFGDTDTTNEFLRRISQEKEFTKLKNSVLAGSQTALRQLDDHDLGVTENLADNIIQTRSIRGGIAATAANQLAPRLKQGVSEASAEKIARILTGTDQATAEQAFRAIEKLRTDDALTREVLARIAQTTAGTLGAVAGSQLQRIEGK